MAVEDTLQNETTFLKSLRIVHTTLFVGQLILIGVAVVLSLKGVMQPETDMAALAVWFAPLVLMAIPGSVMLFRRRLVSLKQEPDYGSKLKWYRQALTMRYSIVHGAVTFAVIYFLISGAKILVLAGILVAIYFLLIRPNANSIRTDLAISNI